ncbi:MAG: hypothetical protein GF399_01470 [Candidatus Coatesbacteria bacterium]|nr:hypothetical protein [Candidatus Coatesbacteria bacterium]
MEFLLHICCGVCALETVPDLRGEGWSVLGAWCNPNIEPPTEHQRRLAVLATVERELELPLVRLEAPAYRPPTTELSAERCAYCYRLRLEPVARRAAALGTAFSTTLLYSRHQRHELVRRVAEALSRRCGAPFVYRDWRPLFNRGQSRSRALGLYRQNYCGCLASLHARRTGG